MGLWHRPLGDTAAVAAVGSHNLQNFFRASTGVWCVLCILPLHLGFQLVQVIPT